MSTVSPFNLFPIIYEIIFIFIRSGEREVQKRKRGGGVRGGEDRQEVRVKKEAEKGKGQMHKPGHKGMGKTSEMKAQTPPREAHKEQGEWKHKEHPT